MNALDLAGISWLTAVLVASFNLFVEMAPYLLLGFAVAGILHVFLPVKLVAAHLGQNSFGAVVKAVIFGTPLPLCSCSVLPASATLKRAGASTAAVLAFLIATPMTGIDSILATYALLGGGFTAYRVLAAVGTAILAGFGVLWFAKNLTQVTTEEKECCHRSESDEKTRGLWQKLAAGIRYGFVDLVDELARPLVLGTLIGGVIAALLPVDLIDQVQEYDVVVALAVSIPMYVCATGSIPIAAALIAKGMSFGAGLVFLLAGPATNAVTISVVKNELGSRAVMIYLGAISLVSLASGLLLNYLGSLIPGLEASAPHHTAENMLPLDTVWAVLLIILLLASAWRQMVRRPD